MLLQLVKVEPRARLCVCVCVCLSACVCLWCNGRGVSNIHNLVCTSCGGVVRGWQVGHACVIEQLGDVQARPGWQDTEGNFYWPKGFSSRRTFPSMRQEGKCSYQCEVNLSLCLASLSCLFVLSLCLCSFFALPFLVVLSLCLFLVFLSGFFCLLSTFFSTFFLFYFSSLCLFTFPSMIMGQEGTAVSVPGSSSLLLPLLPAESRVLKGLGHRA
jgi:hypothetical protein